MLLKFIKDAWLVLVAAVVFGLLVAAVHGLLIGRIKRNADDKLTGEMRLLLSDASDFQPMTADAEEPDYFIATNDNGQVVGYALRTNGSGFVDNIALLVTFSADLSEVRGIAVLASSESPGIGDKINGEDYCAQYIDKPADAGLFVTRGGTAETGANGEIMGITSATISSQAVTDIVNQATARIQELVQ